MNETDAKENYPTNEVVAHEKSRRESFFMRNWYATTQGYLLPEKLRVWEILR